MNARISKLRKVSARRSHRHTSLSATRRIMRKATYGRLRKPLSIRSATNGARHKQLVDTPAPSLRLPRTLVRPQVGEVDREPIESAHPEIAHIPTEYIRKGLVTVGTAMLAAVANVHSQPPTSTLPRELEIVVNDMLAAHYPTHMLAIYSNSSAEQKRKVTLFPTHHLVLAVHCNNLPAFPVSSPDATDSAVQVPVVPLCLPSPETFSVLQSYLYTKRVDALLAALLPAPPSSLSDPNVPLQDMISRLTNHLAATGNMPTLARHAMVINGVWRNACALGVYDDKLWRAIEVAWEAVVGAIGMLRGQC